MPSKMWDEITYAFLQWRYLRAMASQTTRNWAVVQKRFQVKPKET